MVHFKIKYFGWMLLLLAIEFLIAIYAHDEIIRPYFGDFLVVILLYCFIKSLFNISNKTVAISVLLFSYGIETLQHFQIVKLLGLSNLKWANILIGTSFAWTDLLMYILGILLVLVLDSAKNRSDFRNPKHNETHIFI